MRATAFLLASISISIVATRHNEPHRLRQATRHSVIGRALANKYVNLDARDPLPSDNPTNPTCWCDDNNTVTVTEAKRDADIEILGGTPTQKRVWPATRHWIPIVDFDGLMLPPIQAAQFMRSEGYLFDHPTNGSVNLRDEGFIAHSLSLRKKVGSHHHIKRNSELGDGGGLLVKFSGSWFVKYIAKQLAQGESDGFAPEDLVMKLSNEYGLKASDLIPMNRLLLADPNLKEIIFHFHVLTRDMLEYMVEAMCPALGPVIYDASLADEAIRTAERPMLLDA